jgi:hypothetical protein
MHTLGVFDECRYAFKASATHQGMNMTTCATFTATNLDANIGETVTIERGMFCLSPWSYQKPVTSGQFGLDGVPSGVYTITAKIRASENDGAAVQYTLTAKA